MSDDIFQRACLIHLETNCWPGTFRLPDSALEKIGDAAWLRGKKHLIEPEHLNNIRAVITAARRDLNKHALPFPIKGLILVPKDLIAEIDKLLLGHQQEFHAKVAMLYAVYDELVEKARAILEPAGLFNETEYPTDLALRFGFAWRFIAISTPQHLSVLTPEIFERERANFLALMEQTRNAAVASLRTEFAEFVDHLTERLFTSENAQPKIFKASSIVRFQEFLELFDDRNLFQDDELQDLVTRASDLLKDTPPEWLRDDPTFRRHIATGMAKIKTQSDQLLTDLPRRLITLPKAA